MDQLRTDIPPATYHAMDGISFHTLIEIDRSPLHCRWRQTHPKTSTPQMELGEACHVAILQPDLFASLYAEAPKVDRRTKEGKAQLAEAEQVNQGKALLAPDDYRACVAMRDSVLGNPALRKLLAWDHQTELSMFWTDEPTGLACRGRADWLARERATLVDLKTTKDAGVGDFENSIARYHYHAQLAFYADGLKANGVALQHHIIIAVENEAPYGVAAYLVQPEAIDAGRTENRNRLARYAQCLKANCWPGYPTQIQDVSLPSWKWRQVNQLLETA